MHMKPTDPHEHLSQIATLWTLVDQAHGQEATEATAARQRLLERYGGAVQKYLVGALRDPEAAHELTQEFAVRFMSGKYHGADRERGRFRNFVKGVLGHLIADHYRRRQAQPNALPLDGNEAKAPDFDPTAPDPLFVENWRQALLSRAWQALAEIEAETSQPFHTVMRLRVDQPDASSTEMAEHLSTRLGKPVTAAGVRQTLHRARDRFADLLLDEVVQTLGPSADEDLEQELIELNLLTYCQAALARRAKPLQESPHSAAITRGVPPPTAEPIRPDQS
jgi:DNA-directed RNA polymerase specialized sigma24 family protein